MNDIIQITMGELQSQFDNEVMRAVQQVGISVDKDKLIEALQLSENLVRCQDCRYSKPSTVFAETKPCIFEQIPSIRCILFNIERGEEDFCSSGERQTERGVANEAMSKVRKIYDLVYGAD